MELSQLTSQELVRLCLSIQDKDMWAEFVRRFQPVIKAGVIKVLRRYGKPGPCLVDDLIQETYLRLCANNFKALRGLEYEHEFSLSAFLKVVASNVAEDHFRTSLCKKRGGGHLEEALADSEVPTPETKYLSSMERMVLMAQVTTCLEKQSTDTNYERDSEIFWLYYQHGLTAMDISRLPLSRLSVKGVESTLLRMTRLVRAKLNP